MIIVQLKGGLGNQLFQYAAGLSLSLHHQVPLKVDISLLGQADGAIGTVRNFDLSLLHEPPVVASAPEISKFSRQIFFKKYYQKLLSPYRREIYKEAAFSYDRRFFEAGTDIYLKGYRQSARYFLKFENVIRQKLIFVSEITNHLHPFDQELKKVNSIAIHVRRGDYAKTSDSNYFADPGEKYYKAAINNMTSKTVNPSWFIFSDDPNWVKTHIHFPVQVQYVSGNISKTHLEDFYLMSRCKHNIIANSTFSWWAAWLNNNPDKIVIAPNKWFNKASLDTKDLIPEGWIKI